MDVKQNKGRGQKRSSAQSDLVPGVRGKHTIDLSLAKSTNPGQVVQQRGSHMQALVETVELGDVALRVAHQILIQHRLPSGSSLPSQTNSRPRPWQPAWG